MTSLRSGCLIILGLTTLPSQAAAQCSDGPCYDLDQYTYTGITYCRRYYSNSFRYFGTVGSIPNVGQQPAISNTTISQKVFNAWSNWRYYMSVGLESAGPDTSRSDYCRVIVVDNATFDSNWGTAANGGPLAVTLRPESYAGGTYPDGTVRYSRTFIRGENNYFNWQADCTNPNTPCAAGVDFDLEGVLTHELGHWWVMNDVFTGNCSTVTMWHEAVNSGTGMRSLTNNDIDGISLLYSSPTSVGHSFFATPGPAEDTLRWAESDPGRGWQYVLRVSDSCWGPFAEFAVVTEGDPLHTSDNRNYLYIAPAPYARAYHYELLVAPGSERATAVSMRPLGVTPTPPSTPTALTAALSGGQVNLTWSPSSGQVSAYYLYRHWLHLTNCDVQYITPWETIGPLTSTAYTDPSPPCCDSLFYTVRAVNSTGGSNPSIEAAVDLTVLVGVAGGDARRAVSLSCGPNPARDAVDVRYTTTRRGRVKISLYDVTGRMIARPVDELQSDGEHTVRLDTRLVNSSITFVEVSCNGATIGRRPFVVLR